MGIKNEFITAGTGATELQDSLLISCPGQGGLVFLGNGDGRILTQQPATGIHWSDAVLLSACQDDGGRELWVVENGLPQKVRLSEDALDIHDVFMHENRIYIAATEQNSVICLSSKLEQIDSWGLPGENDSSHLNSVTFYEGRLLASIFGRFDTNRQYKDGTVGLGEVIDIRSGDVFLDGLSQPHSLTVDGELLYLCSSEDKQLRIYKGQSLVEKVDLPGYTRGIGVGREKLYIGISRSRNIEESAHSLPGGAVAILDKESMQLDGMVPITLQEIYDIRVVPEQDNLFGLASESLHRSITGLKDARMEIEGLADLTRNLQAELGTTQAALGTTQAELGTTQAELGTTQAELGTTQAELGTTQAELGTTQAELGTTQAELGTTQAALGTAQAELGAARAELSRIQAELSLVLNSRSWAITKPLRAANRIFGQR